MKVVASDYDDVAMPQVYRSYAVANAIDKVKDAAGAAATDLAERIERELNV